MTHTLDLKVGDLKPDLIVDLYDDATGQPVDLSTASAITVRCWRNNILLFERDAAPAMSPEDRAGGIVRTLWQAGDTSEEADLYLEVEVVWPGSKPQTFPPGDEYLRVRVRGVA